MDMSGRTDSLAARHAALERDILAEMRRPHPDDVRVAALKRQKLRLKDEMQRMRSVAQSDGPVPASL